MVDEKRVREAAEVIRKFKRAAAGLPIDEKDIMAYLVNADDTKERTRLSEHNVYGHSALQLLTKLFPYELDICKDMADMEDTYMISLEGEQRKEAILMQRAKAEISSQQPLTIQLPQTKPQEEQQPQPEQKKKGLFHR